MSPEPAKVIGLFVADPNLQDVLSSVFADEGYIVRAWSQEPASLDEFLNPPLTVLLLSIGPRDRTLPLLDSLRVHPALSGLPIVVIGTLEYLQEEAHASGNVVAVLPSPFDLPDLLGAIEAAAQDEPFEARIQSEPIRDAIFQEAADLLLRSERRIILAWFQRTRAEETLSRYEALSPREFINSVPRLLNALALVLRHEAPPDILAQDPELRGRIREHMDLRQRQGIPAEIVVHEYQVLRRIIFDVLRADLTADAVLHVLPAFLEQLDLAVRLSVADARERWGR